jgi:hypothetical protein
MRSYGRYWAGEYRRYWPAFDDCGQSVLRRNRRFHMSCFPEHPDGDIDREPLEDSHHVVYLVKRRAYAFAFAVPRTPLTTLGAERAFFQMHFTDACRACDIALGLHDLEDLYESLLRLMEYMRQEREKHSGQL